jgi:hypothetical protein
MSTPTMELRAEVFEQVRSTAAVLINSPEIAGEYGSHAQELGALIASSYPVSIEDGALVMPPQEIPSDNVGVLVLLPEDDIRTLDASSYFGSLPAQITYDAPAERID